MQVDLNLAYLDYTESGDYASVAFNFNDVREMVLSGLSYVEWTTADYDGAGNYFEKDEYKIRAIESFHVQTVPVPSAIWLFLSGLLTVIGFVRRA